MRVYVLDDPTRAIDPTKHGVNFWRVTLDDAEATIEGIKREQGYVDQDVVELSPSTENLDAICAKFDKEHYHTEDEVRFVLEGDGIFDVRDEGDAWIRIEVTKGDIISIPARKYHRFYLTDQKHIRCMRLFANHDGWAPLYRVK
jgi:1,2-dihydroxy-3-keto-5-methylthiopentene dioxygenase